MNQNTTDTTILQVSQLQLRTLDATLLNDINWRIRRNENWAVLGANGSGKTLLLSTIMLYQTPTKGEISLLGESYEHSDWFELRKRIGLVSHILNPRIPNDETALLTVASGKLGQLGYWEREGVPDERGAMLCLKKMGIPRLADREWATLSQGERQKVLIARALMSQPELLILDEPCAGLDPVARESFLLSLRELLRTCPGLSLVMVTHHVEEILPEMTHVLLLKNGRILAKGSKRSVLRSSLLSEAYGAAVILRKNRKLERWALSIS